MVAGWPEPGGQSLTQEQANEWDMVSLVVVCIINYRWTYVMAWTVEVDQLAGAGPVPYTAKKL